MPAPAFTKPTSDPRDTRELPDPVMVADQATLLELVRELNGVSEFGVDPRPTRFTAIRKRYV